MQDSPALCMMKEVAALARLAEREVRSAGCWTILALPFLHSYTGHGTYSLRRKKVHTKYNTIQSCVLLVYSTSQLKKHPILRHYSLAPRLSLQGAGEPGSPDLSRKSLGTRLKALSVMVTCRHPVLQSMINTSQLAPQ